MMTITLSNTGKRFNRDWIFRRLNFEFTTGNAYAITGANGSGKSTLLQVLAGSMATSEGQIAWRIGNTLVDADDLHQHLTIAAPYLELIEEMTLNEFLHFHFRFKGLLEGCSIPQIIGLLGLQQSTNKQIRYFSSGMKQRVKLAQAFFAQTPLLFLDEPTTNLDEAGIGLYQHLISTYTSRKLMIISSNDAMEYATCGTTINIMAYK